MWELFYDKRPWTTNKERNLHHHQRAKLVKEWRTAFKELALEAGIPALPKINVSVTPILPDRRVQDTAACNPAAKAAIDGIVDAGVIPDDTPEYLAWIKFYPCKVKKGHVGLLVQIEEVEDE